jgi:hypothetical protein
VNFSARLDGFDALFNNLKKLGTALAPAVTQAAGDALAATVEETREASGLNAPLARRQSGSAQQIGASDPDSIARELGTLDLDPSPWLAPSLPAAQGPMRAAIATAAARAISAFRANRG